MNVVPKCRWRRGSRCLSPKMIGTPRPVVDSVCRRCYFPDHEPIAKLPPLPLLACTSRSPEPTGHCGTCGDPKNTAKYDCEHFDDPAVVLYPRKGMRDCQSCNVRYHLGADQFLATLSGYPSGVYSGRGVVIAGGGKYWPSAYVSARMLRHVGCTLPIQIWHLRGEADPRYERLLAPHGVTVVDADRHPARAARRIVNGFELKLFATINAPFEEVLFLDADNYPCADPTPLFDEPRYRASGGVYWPDLPETNAWTNWPFWGVEKHGPECGFETGQYLLNKRAAWRQLKLAEWYDDRSDWCYGVRSGGDHGDKGPHRVAWAKLRIAPTVFTTRATWRGCAFLQPGSDGKPMFVHRCRSKFNVGDNRFKTTPQNGDNQRCGLPGEEAAFGYLAELRNAT
jgi:hypothetical protein